MQKQISDASFTIGVQHGVVGVALMFVAGLFLGEVGGSDSGFFLALTFLFGAPGLFLIVAGGVAVGISSSRRDA